MYASGAHRNGRLEAQNKHRVRMLLMQRLRDGGFDFTEGLVILDEVPPRFRARRQLRRPVHDRCDCTVACCEPHACPSPICALILGAGCRPSVSVG